ncbi:MAG: UDP-2,3-diacylglucosamine diphosphatase [Alphaproteobacteria bacterium]|nr:UDP-2,3-diacylglucosamine diphosphatase [Alphaproteobacteria bacterium]
MREIRHHRAIFLSDIHLGTRGCKADLLAQFLANHSCETLYLVGDIIDGWELRKGWHWSPAQTEVVRELLRKVDAGTRIVYVPGNHDEFLRGFSGRVVAGIRIVEEAVHQTADGRNFLVTHGDQFERFIACTRWGSFIGDRAYLIALLLNDGVGFVRRILRLPYWSFSTYLKRNSGMATAYIASFESAVADGAAKRNFDGVICGHIHSARMRDIGGVRYLNDGDWVESCTALVEDWKGNFDIVRWRSVPSCHKGPIAWAPAAGVPRPSFVT